MVEDPIDYVFVGQKTEPDRQFWGKRGYRTDVDLETYLNLPLADTLFSIYGVPHYIRIGEHRSGDPAGYNTNFDVMRIAPGAWSGLYFYETLAHELSHRGQYGGGGHGYPFRHSPSGAHIEGMADATAFAHSAIRELGRPYKYTEDGAATALEVLANTNARWPTELDPRDKYSYTNSDILKQMLYLLDLDIYSEHPAKTDQEVYKGIYDAYIESLGVDKNK